RNWRKRCSSCAATDPATSPGRFSPSTADSTPPASACRRCAASEGTADETLLSAPVLISSGCGGTTEEPRMRMAVIKLVLVTTALCAAIAPAPAEVRILASPGGQ